MDAQLSEVLDLNVGGMHFTTMRTTLTKYPDSMLATMFSGRHVINQDKDGRYVIDCDGKIFHHILEFLRFETLPPSDVYEAVYRYSEYFQLKNLSEGLLKLQPCSHDLHLSELQDRNQMNTQLADKVVECLSKTFTQKNNTIYINVLRKYPCHKSDCQIIKNVRAQLNMHIQPLTWWDVLVMGDENIQDVEMDQVFFLTTNKLHSLGYGPNILYSTYKNNNCPIDTGCFLFCKDHVLSRLHKITYVKFRCQPNMYQYSPMC